LSNFDSLECWAVHTPVRRSELAAIAGAGAGPGVPIGLPWQIQYCLPPAAVLGLRMPRPIRRNGRQAAGTPPTRGSAANAELLDDPLIARVILALHVVEQLTALADHLEQAPTRVIVLLV